MNRHHYFIILSLTLALSLVIRQGLWPDIVTATNSGHVDPTRIQRSSQANSNKGQEMSGSDSLLATAVITPVTSLTNEPIVVDGMVKTRPLPAVTAAEIGAAAIITSEGFEGVWPSPGWLPEDLSDVDGGEYLWGKRNCQPHTGSFGGRSVGGGDQGTSLSCSANYPNNIFTWATYGPFNLGHATAASLTFHLRGETEGGTGCPYDYLFTGSSIDAINFSGSYYCGNWTAGDAGNGYYQRTLNLNDQLGESEVWVAFVFSSDDSITFNGITIDDITLNVIEEGTSQQPPVAPTNLIATAVSNSQIMLNWQDNSTDEAGFEIERSLDGINWQQIAVVGTDVTSYANTNLSCGPTYFYQIRAYNMNGNSAYSNMAQALLPCPNAKIYLPIISKSPTCVSGPNQPPAFPNPFSSQVSTERQYNSSGQLIGAVTTITIPPASDPNCDPLTYTWSATNGSITGNGLTAIWQNVIEFGQIKKGDVTVVVRDGRGGSDSYLFRFQ